MPARRLNCTLKAGCIFKNQLIYSDSWRPEWHYIFYKITYVTHLHVSLLVEFLNNHFPNCRKQYSCSQCSSAKKNSQNICCLRQCNSFHSASSGIFLCLLIESGLCRVERFLSSRVLSICLKLICVCRTALRATISHEL